MPFLDIEGLWQRMYVGTAMNGRRGAVVHAMGAVEMALWDLKGRALGKPVGLLGGAQRKTMVLSSLQPASNGFAEYRDALGGIRTQRQASQRLQGGEVGVDDERPLMRMAA